jgi:hypothetical protein
MSQNYKGEALVFHEGAQFGYGVCVILLPRRKLGLGVLGNNMSGINAATNLLAYHLIDEELRIPIGDRFDWVTRYTKTFSPAMDKRNVTLLSLEFIANTF